ncbi:putative F-box/FBD/LRR-repeat protein At1g78760 [Papaver somniferum]|uniref:putative F-box/FBD/LRR-repeat protein At1g78760 n=1 Tax=Papaver somniferum TaxID=3469 RepID=UPI000E6FEB81|nr:putative F-box/FBD/LRR-repeat protein At1g78760 [Papaver somniferum]
MNSGENSSCSVNEDRISNLPDALIHEILAFIDMKYVVKTCVLSKRWRYIWTSLPKLRFVFYEETDEEEEEQDEEDIDSDLVQMRFVNLVNKVLSLHDNSDIHTFYLDAYRNWEITLSDMYRWIATVVSHNVQELSIDKGIDKDFEIPACLCACKSLTKLELRLENGSDLDHKVILPSAVSLPRLKSLRLNFGGFWFDDEKLTNKFFSSLPTLESLVIRQGGLNNMNLNMSFPNLTYFEFYHPVDQSNNVEVKLYVPSLTSIILKGYMPAIFFLEDLSSSVSADMHIWIKRKNNGKGVFLEIHAERKESYTQLVLRFLRGLHNARVLKLNSSFFEALGGSPDILKSRKLQFRYLKLLKLSVGLSRDSMRTIFYMLKISPNIESLYMRLGPEDSLDISVHPFYDEVKLNSENVGGLGLPDMAYYLKFVEIKYLKGSVNELKLLADLLKHATVLERVVLCSFSTKEELKQKEKEMEKFYELLLTFPKASTNVMISYSVSEVTTFSTA